MFEFKLPLIPLARQHISIETPSILSAVRSYHTFDDAEVTVDSGPKVLDSDINVLANIVHDKLFLIKYAHVVNRATKQAMLGQT